MRFGTAIPRWATELDIGFDPGAAVAGVAEGAANVAAANIQEKGQLALAQQEAQEQAQLEQQAFNQQVNYVDSTEQALRTALAGVTSEGNPYYEAVSQEAEPAFAGGGTFGPTSTPSQESGSDTSSYSDPVVRGITGAQTAAAVPGPGATGAAPTGAAATTTTGGPGTVSTQPVARRTDPVASGIANGGNSGSSQLIPNPRAVAM